MTAGDLRRFCGLDQQATAKLDRAYDTLRLSARAADRVVKVARTIADLEGAEHITLAHVAESLSYRDVAEEPRG
jgi:magnesium chelatase family protein